MRREHPRTTIEPRTSLHVALGEYDTGWQDPPHSLARAEEIARQAKAIGADLLVLPEMCATGFTMEAGGFADPMDGPFVQTLSSMAAQNSFWIVAGVAMKREGRYLNSALTFAPDGSVVGTYDKQRLFEFAGENKVYSAGSMPCVLDIAGFSIAVLVCFDLRFPELFRRVHGVDAFVIIANWPSVRQQHWEVLTRARAIENQSYVIAVNRIGSGGGLEYIGGSAVVDPLGNRIDLALGQSSLRTAEISRSTIKEMRSAFPMGSQVAPPAD